MKVFFVNRNWSPLADVESGMLLRMREELVRLDYVKEVMAPEFADVILIQEHGSFKNFRYIDALLADPVISRYTEKVFTINGDDCATGLLRGLYTSLPKSRFGPRIHAAIPFMDYPNELIFSQNNVRRNPLYLAGWRGNTRSNALRLKMMTVLKPWPEFCLETTDSWLNHGHQEKEKYKELILDSKFSLCPAGWAPVSFRIYESMALGRCPVILADEFVPPSGPDWKAFALFYPEKEISGLRSFLKGRVSLHEGLGRTARENWEKYFSPSKMPQYFVRALLNLVDHAGPTSREREVKRWRSLALYWQNKWTLPQRIINKTRKWSRVLRAH